MGSRFFFFLRLNALSVKRVTIIVNHVTCWYSSLGFGVTDSHIVYVHTYIHTCFHIWQYRDTRVALKLPIYPSPYESREKKKSHIFRFHLLHVMLDLCICACDCAHIYTYMCVSSNSHIVRVVISFFFTSFSYTFHIYISS